MINSMKQTVIKNPGWWKRRNSTEKSLTTFAVLATTVAVALAIALAVVIVKQHSTSAATPGSVTEALSGDPPYVVSRHDPSSKEEDSHDDVCFSAGCVHTASSILNNLDESVDPCDDFYQFSCGGFLKNTVIPDSKSSVNAFSIIGDKLTEQLRLTLEEKMTPETPKPLRLAGNFYKACMNKTIIEERGLKPLHEILNKLGGFPALEGDSWKEKEFTWIQSVYNFRKLGYSVDYYMDFSIGIDVKNSTKRIIDLDQASLGLSREYLNKGLSDKLVKAYYSYMVDITVLLGADRERATKELNDSLAFEIALANISWPIEKRRNPNKLYNPMTVKQLQENYPSVPWKEYINTLLSPHEVVGDDEVVIVDVPSFITGLEALLKKTPKRTQANYVMWRVVSASVPYLSEDVRRRQLAYAASVSGTTERESRWKECVDIVSGSLSLAVGAQYVRKYFNEDSKKAALDMVENIRSEFRYILENHVDWMDATTKASAIDKADSMHTHIAYPSELLDDNKLTEFYENLEISPDLYMESVLNLTLFGTDYSFKQLRKPINKTDWVTRGRPAIVNAFYSATENSIQFPAGILQGTFFSSQRPKYMNYGAIGFVIGHEITHGFDDQGRQFDKAGNLVDWWAEETKAKYLEKAKCIVDQYSNYTVKEVNLNLNGINTQGENIADNGGIKEAYLAYNRWAKKNGQEPKLPGLNYTPQQLFWLSVANTWCSVYRPEALNLRITTGLHAPSQFRVNGPISNMDDFAKDFNCPIGSKMNPHHKCKVW